MIFQKLVVLLHIKKNMNMKTIRKKILTLAMILASVNAFGRQAHSLMSAFGQGADANYTCNVTAKFDNGKFIHYTGCTIFPHTKTPNAKVRVSIDAEETKHRREEMARKQRRAFDGQ